MNVSSTEALRSIVSNGGTLATNTVQPWLSRLLFTPFQYWIKYLPLSAIDLLSTPMSRVMFSEEDRGAARALEDEEEACPCPPAEAPVVLSLNSSLNRSVKGVIPATGSRNIWSNPEKPWHNTSGYFGVS